MVVAHVVKLGACLSRSNCNFVSAFSSLPPASDRNSGNFKLFDRNVKRLQKNRAALRDKGARSLTVDYIRDEVASRMMERLMDIRRKFNSIADLGSGPGHFSKLLEEDKVKSAILVDPSEAVLFRDPDSDFKVHIQRVHADEEDFLQILKPNSQEGVVSCLSLHWINDLPGMLTKINEVLQPDGLFLGAMFGGDTLFELRTSFQLAEVEREGGISPRISPMTDTRDISNLLGKAGFTLLTVDLDEIEIFYPSMWELIADLQDMGEGNAVYGRRHFIHRNTLAAASAIYKEMYGGSNGNVPATFQVIYMIGWKPAPNQPIPLARGIGKINLKDALRN